MQYIHPAIIFFYGGTLLTTQFTNPGNLVTSYYTEKISYINCLPNTSVTVTNRHGISVTVPSDPPLSGDYGEVFVIRRVIFIDHRVIQSYVASLGVHHILNPITDSAASTIKEYIDANPESTQQYTGCTINLDCVVTMNELRAGKGSLYFNETDLVVSMLPSTQRIIHPFSKEKLRNDRLESHLKQDPPNTFFYKIEIVDNFNRYGRRYFRIAGEVYSVDPIHDQLRKCGIYVTRTKPCQGGFFLTELIEDYYSIEDGEKELMLFRSFEQAKMDGDVNLHRKKEMSDLEYETQKLKMEANKVAAEEKATPDTLKKIIDVIKPMSVLLVSIFGGVKLIYNLGKAAGTK